MTGESQTPMALCAGRPAGLAVDAVCDRRGTCARFLGLLAHEGRSVPLAVHVGTGLCRDGHDWHVAGCA